MKSLNIKQIFKWVIPHKVFIFRSGDSKINVLVFFTCKNTHQNQEKCGETIVALTNLAVKTDLRLKNFRLYIMQICNTFWKN